MSPEQLSSAKDVDARADIWALGVILHEMLTAHFPFDAEDLPRTIVKILNVPPDPVSESRADVPPALNAVILRCLSKDRGDRFATVAELATALVPFGPPRAEILGERIARIVADVGARSSPSLGSLVTGAPISRRARPERPGEHADAARQR
jgi:serine/threonine-protein kinase